MRGKLAILSALMLSACAATDLTTPAAPWPPLPTAFAAVGDLNEAVARFPNSAALQQRRLDLALNASDAATALDAASRLASMGAGLPPPVREQLGKVIGAEAAERLIPIFNSNSAPIAPSNVHATIPAAHRLIEGVAWDSRRSQLYATSVVDRRLLAVTREGVREVAGPSGIGSLFTGHYDSANDRIWLVAASVEQTPADGGRFAGLLSFSPAAPAAVIRLPLPAAGEAGPNDIAAARDGTLYVSDMVTGAIYRCRPGCSAPETFVTPRTLRSAHGMAVSQDQKRLYVADFRYGLASVDLATGQVSQVAAPSDMMLDGIDGLFAYDGDLIGIQGGTFPARIVRLSLSRDGRRVERLRVLERANPAWGEPTLGTIAGNRLLYVANAQWERYGPGGAPTGNGAPEPTVIRALSLD
ncbi:MAG TPA: SMP-30/gluconolactonase/LRE family protein [Allosphingosinicella sp.]|uniref:SMP-30/gluconolactonase/LRE family protein n=1 Tax=Allosphingosinicella sp. TaxID=2823234 RepID=UPI002EDAF752